MNARAPVVMVVVAFFAVIAAIWLARAIPESVPPVTVAGSDIEPEVSVMQPGRATGEQTTPVPLAPEPPVPAAPPATTTPPTPQIPPTPVEAPRWQPSDDWLAIHYGLETAADRDTVDALVALTQSLDFDRFWHQIRPLAAEGNEFAQYLALAFRDFVRLDMTLLEFGYVEEPYLNQRRRQQTSPNWLHWLFANWRSDWRPDDAQIQQAFNRALAGDTAAQTLVVSQSAWFRNNPDLAPNLDELLDRLSDNPYLQVLNLTQLNARVLDQAENDVSVSGLGTELGRSRHPLSQWLARRVSGNSASPTRERADLLNLAQDGYLTAVQEVGRLAIGGRGRWTDSDETPIDMNDAISVYQALEAQQPDNPLISVALCELYLEAGDYQASWQYLQKFAYQDAWADEVEDYSCLAGNHRLYGELMINRGVITEQQWQQHLQTIDARRERIRG